MKSLMLLWKMLADESASICRTSATLDFKRVECRCKHEGLSFLTITLASFGKDFEKSLDQGHVDRNMFQGFSWHAGLPRFLGGFLDHVFDRGSGELLDEPSIEAIIAIRQLTLMFSKIRIQCSDARVRAAMDSYVECEKEVKVADACLSSQNIESFGRVSALLFQDLFSVVDRRIHDGDVVPKHGPGITADRLVGNDKFRLRTWTDRLEEILPAGEFLLPNWSFYDQYAGIHHLEPGAETPVKVVPVPKTQKTPRIIAMEPTAMQYAQQGLLEQIRDALQGRQMPSRRALSRVRTLDKMIGLDDQTPNQRLALQGSKFGTLATLDMSEASDRVSNQHVRILLRNHRWLFAAVDACRSRKADVPGHGVIRLAKYASMGSALTFPLEAMVFLTIIFLGIEREHGSPLDRRTVNQLSDQVRVFGDDIIVPVDYVHSVIGALQDFGLVVNANKSFWTGRFRESCGKEYYDGEDVSIVRVRRVFPTSRQHGAEIISIVSLRNQLYMAGYWRTVGWLDDYITRLIKFFPVVEATSSVLGRLSSLPVQAERMDTNLQAPLVKGYREVSKPPINRLDGAEALLKWFLKRGRDPLSEDHLVRAGRPKSVKVRLGWAQPY